MWSMAHNDYLQTLVEFGWIGLSLACAVLLGGIAHALRAIRIEFADVHDSDGILIGGVVAALLGVIVHAMFDFPLQIASIQVTVIVLLGICWSARSSD